MSEEQVSASDVAAPGVPEDAAEAAAARRSSSRPWLVVGVAVALAGVALAVSWALRPSSQTADPAAVPALPSGSAPAADLLLPPGVDPVSLGFRHGPASGVPVLEVWEDFQCPACGVFEEVSGPSLRTWVSEGRVALLWRPTTFLDDVFGNDSSVRATSAWGCAIEAGVGAAFHDAVFAGQPPVEGLGFTDERLLEFGSEAGVPDAASFAACVRQQRYAAWAEASTARFFSDGVDATPSGKVNGEPVSREVLGDPVALANRLASAS